MIDLNEKALLLAEEDAALVAGASVFVGNVPPPAWDPGGGPAVVLVSRGGPVEYEGLLRYQLQIKGYGSTAVQAWDAYALAHDALHETHNSSIVWSSITVTGQLLPPEPLTERRIVLAYAELIARPS